MKSLLLSTGLALLLAAASAFAVIETYDFSDPGLELRYRQLSTELRCPKCQNQNIADSNAPIAQDLRKLVYQQLEAGASDEQIIADLVSRYGEFVRYRPRFGGVTAMLWLAPVLLLALGIAVVVLTLRGRHRRPRDAGVLNEQEQQRLQRLLDKQDPQP